ncbi:MAG: class I SAM-dependent methyltransferase [Minisyncoccia bacterium]
MFSNPEDNVHEFGFIAGQSVADFGSGAGHYTFALSKVLGVNGRVYAVDIQEEMLTHLSIELKQNNVENVRVVLGDIEKLDGTHLKEECVDGVVFSNILFQLDHKESAVKEAFRILKSGGKACIVEWHDLSFLAGVRKEDRKVVVTEEETRNLFINAGFKFERTFESGDHHYGLIFKKP